MANEAPSIIPEPAHMQLTGGATASRNIDKKTKDASLGEEGYTLNITPQGIQLKYGGESGLFYAEQTLDQLKAQFGSQLPCLNITDSPRYAWRGLMIDPARHFWQPEDIKKFIDVMAAYKFNKLHLHLTDDQGWRLPIPGYPKLQTIASKRAETDGNKTPHEGMYTKEELKDIVEYAAKHHIEIIPEIDVPGHNQALASAYPEMICFPNPELKVRETAGVSKELVCPAREQVWQFYRAVVNELHDIFPSPLVHLGGDEAPTDNWDKCPACAALREKAGLKNGHDQLGDFFAKMTALLAEKGKKPLLWYEESAITYPEGAIVYTWRNGKTPSTIKQTREKNLKLICSAGEHCYLNRTQLKGDVGVGPLTPLEQCYRLDPGYNLPEEQQKHIIGVEAVLWGEKISTPQRANYLLYPRGLAIAEAGWSPMKVRSWNNFSRKLKFQNSYMKQKWNIDLTRPSDKK